MWPSYEDIAAIRVSVGKPRTWPLRGQCDESGRGLEGPALLVRFAVSFWLGREAEVEWCRFIVRLRGAGAIALDLHPVEVTDGEDRAVSLRIAPTLRFREVELSAGSAEVDVRYRRLVPAVAAMGVGESEFGWDLRPTVQHPIVGMRFFHAIIETASGAVEAELAVDADVRVGGRLLPPLRTPQRAELVATLGDAQRR